jgi:hypothetical protein
MDRKILIEHVSGRQWLTYGSNDVQVRLFMERVFSEPVIEIILADGTSKWFHRDLLKQCTFELT